MTGEFRRALRAGVSCASTALAVNLFHLPQPFLAVLATVLILPYEAREGRDFVARGGAVFAGVFCGIGAAMASPQSYWLSIPIFFLLAGFGAMYFFRAQGMVCGILFCMGIGGMFPVAWGGGGIDFFDGFAHAVALWCAVGSCAFWWGVLEGEKAKATRVLQEPRVWLLGASGSGALVFSAFALPGQGVVMVIAALTTVLGLEAAGKEVGIPRRIYGLLVGVLAGVGFVILIAGSGNNGGIFLLAVGVSFFCFEWLAVRVQRVNFYQVAAIFAVCATMGPGPDTGVFDVLERALAVCSGFFISLFFYFLADAMQKDFGREEEVKN